MLNKLQNEFIESVKEGSILTYRRKIGVFFDFLIEEELINNKNYKEIFKSIDTEKILESIKYYVHNYGIKYETTVNNYVTVIKSFFEFLAIKKEIKNKLFDSHVNKNKLDEEIIKTIRELNLNTKNIKEPLNESEFSALLKECDRIIREYNLDDIQREKGYKPLARNFISAVMMKLAMYTGIKNSTFSNILKNDYDYDYNTIKINGIVLKLPVNLAYDMKKYYKFRENVINMYNIKDKNNNNLFINGNGEFITNATSDIIYGVMKDVLNTKKGERLTKFVIVNMILSGIDTLDIIELTNTSIETCQYCREQGLETSENQIRKNLYDKLKASNLYDLL